MDGDALFGNGSVDKLTCRVFGDLKRLAHIHDKVFFPNGAIGRHYVDDIGRGNFWLPGKRFFGLLLGGGLPKDPLFGVNKKPVGFPAAPFVFPPDTVAALGGDELMDAGDMRGLNNKDAARPIGKVAGAGRGILPIGKAPLVRGAEVGFRRMANDDYSALEFFQKGVQAVAQETGYKGAVLYIAA